MAEPGAGAGAKSAEELRMMMLETQLAEAEKAMAARAAKEKQLADFADSFMNEAVSEQEQAMIRRLVLNAVRDGKFEAMIYTFPSDLCTDSGRAINSGEPDWPATLQGKAKQLYDRYLAVAKPSGYKLKAMIINFPGGMPGDVGFFLSWEPDRV